MKESLSRSQLSEIITCGKDPAYFLKTYAKIQHPVKGTIPFKTYPFQDECLKSFVNHRFNIVLKSRQLGLSTICAGYVVWDAIFHKDRNILVIATKLMTAVNFIKKVKFILNSLPKWLLIPKFTDNIRSVTFDNGSVITAIPTSDDAGRSEALSLLVVDECAFIQGFDDIWTGLSPTLSTGGNAILLSTPNGVGGTYYRIWSEAIAGSNDFNPIKLPWNVHPEHDEKWFINETKSLTKKKINQEFLCSFLASGDTFMTPEDLETIRANIRPPIDRQGHDKNVWIWQHQIADHRYVMSADVARGDASDFSTFHVVDAETGIIAAEYMGKIPPERLADLMLEFGKKYNTALLVPENNTFGYLVATKLRENGYKRLYFASNKGDPFSMNNVDKEELPGFSMNKSSRVQALSKLEELLRTSQLTSYSERLYNELQSFVWQGMKPLAMRDSTDDLIMSLAIAAWIVGDGSGGDGSGAEMATAILNATSVERVHSGQIPGVSSMTGPQVSLFNPYNVYRPQLQQTERQRDATDLQWLYW